MKTREGYSKASLDNTSVLLARGGHKTLDDFLLKAGGGTITAPVTFNGATTFSNPILGDLLGNSTTADRLKNDRAGVASTGWQECKIEGGVIKYYNSNSNTWNANALNVAGYVAAPTASNKNQVWKTDANGNPAWRDDTDYDVTVLLNATDSSNSDRYVPFTASQSAVLDKGAYQLYFKSSYKYNPATNTLSVPNIITSGTINAKGIIETDSLSVTTGNLVVRGGSTLTGDVSLGTVKSGIWNGSVISSAYIGAHTHGNITSDGKKASYSAASDSGKFLNASGVWTEVSLNITSHLYAGASGATKNATTDVYDPYLVLVEGSSKDSEVQLEGAGTVTVSAKNGKITISGSAHTNSDTVDNQHAYEFVHISTEETITGKKTFSNPISGSLLGTATYADRLSNARTISITGAVTGSGSFDGSSNLSISTSVNHNHNSSYVTALGTNGNYLTWTKNGTTNNITVPFASIAGLLSAITTSDNASSTDTWRRVWFSYNDNTTGRPAYSNTFAYLSSTGTLKVNRLSTGVGGIDSATIGNLIVSGATTLTGSTNAGTITASSFVGPLTGNASTATTANGLMGVNYSSGDSNIIKAFWNTKSDSRWYLQSANTSYLCRVDYATSAGNADTLDGIHASGLFTNLSNSGNNISITIGGTNKTLTPAYASSAGSVAWNNVTGKPSSYTPSSHTHPINQVTWTGGLNLIPTATANNQKWSIDMTPGSYTGTYFLIWSDTKSTVASFYHDDGRVNIPYYLTVGSYLTTGTYITAGTSITASNGNITASAGLLKSTLNSNTVTIGSQDSLWAHFTNSLDIPFWFNRGITVLGNLRSYGDCSYSLGDDTYEWSNGQIRSLQARHLDASRNYAKSANNYDLYIGYGSGVPTKNTYFYYSTTDTDKSTTVTSRTLYATINSNGLYANTRFGVNGQNTSHTFYAYGANHMFKNNGCANLYIKADTDVVDQYSVIRFGINGNDDASCIFLNGPKRTNDGGANLMTIRNNVGDLRLNNDVSITGTLNMSSLNITNLKVGGGIYWNPYVESTTANSDAASITVIEDDNGTGGTVLQIKLDNDANDIVNIVTNASTGLKHKGYTVWDANNDGSGSGLDADLLDGIHADAFLRRLRRNNLNIKSADSGQIPPSLLEYKSGYPMHTDPEFASGYNDIVVYNNNNNGVVTITRLADDQGSGNSSGYILKIHSASDASPHYGGFRFPDSTARGRAMTCIFRAKIPSGASVSFHTNSIGSNGNSGWITSTAGTGKWEWYAYHVEAGTANFSTTFFFALNAAADWYLSYANSIINSWGAYDGLRTKYADRVKVQDVRGATRYPSYFDDKSATFWFNKVGTPSGDWYSGIHMKGWNDGYQSWEICSGSTTNLNGNLYYRNGINNSWQSWRTVCILDTSNNLTIAGSYYSNSDIRYKSLITTLDTSIESIASLPIFKYTWNDDKHDTNIHIGSSAQAVMTILPELVTKELDRDFYNLDYATLGVVASITTAKELVIQKSELEICKEKIKQLELRIKELENA